MTAVLPVCQGASLGSKARRLCVFLRLSQRELANMASVSPEEVNSFEHSLPVRLDAKRKVLKELLARKACKR